MLGRFLQVGRLALTLLSAGTLLTALACGGAAPPPRQVKSAVPPALPWEAQSPLVPEVESPLVALVGGTVWPGLGSEVVDGVVLFENGRIVAVGPRERVSVPPGAHVVDVRGRHVTPGLIDAHSHMGVYSMPQVEAHADGNEATRPITPNMRAADAFWPQDPALSHALARGVTTVLVLPGSANLIGGQGVTLKLYPGRSVAEMRFPAAPPTLKMACGENPKRVYAERKSTPSTRMGNVALYREAFQSALEYGARFVDWQARHRSWQHKAGASPSAEPAPSMPARDFGLETLLGALQGRVLVHVHCYRADEMLGMLALAREFGLKIRAFHHAVEAYKLREVLEAEGVGVATWADWWGFKLEAYDAIRENIPLLSLAGVRVSLHSDSSSLVQRLNQEAAKALAAGQRAGLPLERSSAWGWITANPAWSLGIDAQTGSLIAGKMADIVVWSGDPLSVYARVDLVYVDGQVAHDRLGIGRRPSDFELGHDGGIETGRTRPGEERP